MAMVNMEILDIIKDIYDELLNTVILKNVPKDCPNIDEIKDNYLEYLFETYINLLFDKYILVLKKKRLLIFLFYYNIRRILLWKMKQ